MKTIIKGVLFDLDGVLIDTESMIAKVWMDVFSTHSLFLSEAEIISITAGQTFEGVLFELEKHYQWKAPDDFIYTLDQRFSRSFDMVDQIDGAKETLIWLKERHIPFAVASNSSPTRLPLKLKNSGLADWVTHFYSPASVHSKGKPAPDLYLHAALQLGLAQTEALVIEDSVTGVQAGVAAGMTVWGFVAASHSDHSGEPLQQAGATKIIISHEELRKELAAVLSFSHNHA